ncbi:DUF3124 domain-containing protein [Aquimarina sp. W85]|uniref:DUF3124 domain-containing protein n=1 Tax=Aquimarina rhodophyticola TaxID=3342246 RepID=UPI00366D93DF
MKNEVTLKLSNLLAFVCIAIVCSCTTVDTPDDIAPIDWQSRLVEKLPLDSLRTGTTYLSVYSQIYSITQHRKHNLTATISLRNTSPLDTLYIDKALYYDTHGKLIRSYIKKSIFIAPLETVEIVIDEIDKSGGTGANFIFDWTVIAKSTDPLFEGIMISTSGQQGLSFTTQGKRIK